MQTLSAAPGTLLFGSASPSAQLALSSQAPLLLPIQVVSQVAAAARFGLRPSSSRARSVPRATLTAIGSFVGVVVIICAQPPRGPRFQLLQGARFGLPPDPPPPAPQSRRGRRRRARMSS